MAPTTEKPKHVYEPPQWIADIDTKKLPADKAAYWENRKKGVGQSVKLKPKVVQADNPEVQMGFDSEGNMYAKTRAVRRQQPPSDPSKTKKTMTKTERKKFRKLGRR